MNKKIDLISFCLQNFKDKKLKKKFLNNKNTFLVGNWCREGENYSTDLNNLNIFNFYKWSNHKKKTNDTQLIFSIYQKFITSLTVKFNKIHNQNHSEKYWNFLLSRWLLTFISQVYAKWVISSYILKKYKIKKFFVIELNNKDFTPENTEDAHYMTSDFRGYYSHYCFKEIFNYKLNNLNKVKLSSKKFGNIPKKPNNIKLVLKRINVIYFSFFKKIFFYKISFDKKISLILQIKNFVFNFFLNSKKIIIKKKKQDEIRNKFFQMFEKKSGFEGFLIEHMKTLMPKEFLENYSAIYKEHFFLNWPKDPDYIVTSYGQYYDELFKIYCAKNISKKTKLFIFQHGYGTYYLDDNFYSTGWDKIKCNKYFVWGEQRRKGYLPFFYPKRWLLKEGNRLKAKQNYRIISFLYGFNEQPVKSPHGYQDIYIRNKAISTQTIAFYNILEKKLKRKINLRSLDVSYKKKVERTIKNSLHNVQIHDPYLNPFFNQLEKFDITIHFFLGTSFFDTLFVNKPSLLIYNEEHQFKHDKNFIQMLNKLKKNNIVFDDGTKAANFLNKNLSNLENWWNNPKVEKIKEEFRGKYCRNFNIFSKDNRIFS
tara:strand:+ start:1161 stop:2942 length:1782 start_codon:yes stop_codon:yes gene_type:complete